MLVRGSVNPLRTLAGGAFRLHKVALLVLYPESRTSAAYRGKKGLRDSQTVISLIQLRTPPQTIPQTSIFCHVPQTNMFHQRGIIEPRGRNKRNERGGEIWWLAFFVELLCVVVCYPNERGPKPILFSALLLPTASSCSKVLSFSRQSRQYSTCGHSHTEGSSRRISERQDTGHRIDWWSG